MICTMINESLLWAECSGIGEGVAGVLAGDARRCAFLATRRRPTYPSRSPRPGPHPQWQGPVNNPRILPPSPPAVASSSHFPPQARSPLPPSQLPTQKFPPSVLLRLPPITSPATSLPARSFWTRSRRVPALRSRAPGTEGRRGGRGGGLVGSGFSRTRARCVIARSGDPPRILLLF